VKLSPWVPVFLAVFSVAPLSYVLEVNETVEACITLLSLQLTPASFAASSWDSPSLPLWCRVKGRVPFPATLVGRLFPQSFEWSAWRWALSEPVAQLEILLGFFPQFGYSLFRLIYVGLFLADVNLPLLEDILKEHLGPPRSGVMAGVFGSFPVSFLPF